MRILNCLSHKSECKFICEVSIQLINLNTNLLHGITVTDSYHSVSFGIEIVGYAERSTDLVLSSVTFTDVSTIIEFAVVFLG